MQKQKIKNKLLMLREKLGLARPWSPRGRGSVRAAVDWTPPAGADVTQLTLFVDYEEHFDGTIMVHLTTMLVMYTLYASLSSSMPNTAYLKFIDIFMLYALVLPFVAFVCEVIVMIMKHHENTHAGGFEKQNKKDAYSKKIKINNKINIVKVRNLENEKDFAWQDDKDRETENI